MNYGYIQAVTGTPDYHAQHYGILSYATSHGLGPIHICHEAATDHIHGAKPVLSGMLDNFHRGDTLVVTDFLKLGRSTGEVLDVLRALSHRGVKLYVVNSGYRLESNADALVITMACSLFEVVEKELQVRPDPAPAPIQMPCDVADLQTPARRIRKSKLDHRRSEIEELLSTGISLSAAALRLGVSRPTLTDWVGSRNLFVQKTTATTL